MPLNTMQQILCRGAVDRAFLSMLLQAPERALAEYALSAEERAVFLGAAPRSLVDLAAAVEAWRRGDSVAAPAQRELALAG
jgi:hypothetical protein